MYEFYDMDGIGWREKTPAEKRAEAQDRREKTRELVDGAGVIALLFGIPVVSAVWLAAVLPWWFG